MRAPILALLLAACAAPAAAQAPLPLRVGDPVVERVVSPGRPQVYALTLGSDHFVRGVAEQLTADVVVRVLDPGARLIASFDGPARGPEPFRFTTAVAGEYRIEISAFERDSGSYTLRLERAEPVARDPEARLDQVMGGYDRGTPGGVVAVVRNGALSFVRGYGLANLEYDVPNGPETVYHMASVSKQFTAFAILLLAEQGRLSLDDDVRKHLPELPDFGVPITIRHLAHHTSGLRDQWTLWQLAGGRMDDVITQDDLLALIYRQRELNFAPGAEHLYSNTGYTLLAEIVARVSGQPFGQFMQEHVFAPLGMTHTQVYDDHTRLVPGRAYSYQRGPAGAWQKSVLSYANRGATSLFTTAGDLALWLGNFATGKVGGPAVIAAMQQRGRLNNGDSIPYAFGIVHGRVRGLDVLQHSGGDAGFRTFVAWFPALDGGVIALGNDGGFDPGMVAMEAAEAFFGDRMEPRPAPATAGAPPPAPQPANPPASANAAQRADPWRPGADALAAYAGTYFSPELETQYTVLVKDGALVARHRRHGDINLRPARPDQFTTATGFFSEVVFERSGDGRVTGMRVSSGRVRRLLFQRLP